MRTLARENQPAVYQKYLAARQDLSRALLVSVADDGGNDSERRVWLERLNTVKEELEHELARSLPTNESELPAAAEIQTLAATLPRTVAFVEFFSYVAAPFDATVPTRANPDAPERMAAFVVCHGRPVKCVDLGDTRDIAPLVVAWNEAIMADADNHVGAQLRQAVWDPVSSCLPTHVETVYIAPDGVLGAVAWSALPAATDNSLLLEHYAIATVPHGPFLLDQLRQPPSEPETRASVLAVGDVEYGSRDRDVSAVRQGLSDLRWDKLPGSRRELEAIESALPDWHVTLLTGIEATPENVLESLATARVAHFATHGFFIDDSLGSLVGLAADDPSSNELKVNRVRSSVLGRSPLLRSGLALAGANAESVIDEFGIPTSAAGVLTAETVAAIDAGHLRLVVLSACDTSRGDAATGEGVLGIQGAFHIAGARNVIAGLWKVPDEATAELMGEFYRLLGRQQMTPLAALRAAQLHMIGRTEASQTKPRGIDLAATVPVDVRPPAGHERSVTYRVRDWAGFVLSGPGF